MSTIVSAMSGGVDSSLSTAILVEQGHNVIGITMRLFCYADDKMNLTERSCCSLSSINDAKNVCNRLKIPHYIINCEEEFKETVIKNFVNEYLQGKTPNPCVLCNTKIKFDYLIKKSIELGADYLATGHYATITNQYSIFNIQYSIFNPDGFVLCKGKDKEKDQSYFLWGINPNNLSKILFPLGELTKKQVRDKAKQLNLKTANKKESQEVCFIPDNNYVKFLSEYSNQNIKSGPIYDSKGNLLGQHKGIPFYTIGQRKRLGVNSNVPLYVKRIDAKENAIYLCSDENELYSNEMIVENLNWFIDVKDDDELTAKIRYKNIGEKGKIKFLSDDKLKFTFYKPQRAITPGQSAVFYTDDIVAGGGIISNP